MPWQQNKRCSNVFCFVCHDLISGGYSGCSSVQWTPGNEDKNFKNPF